MIEAAFPVKILVRGNEITVTGDAADAERVGRLFEELVVLLEQGHDLDADALGRSIEMLKADQRPSEVLTTEVMPRPQEHPPEDVGSEALRRRGPRQHRDVRDRPRRNRQELSRGRARRAGAAGEGREPHHPHAAGGGGGRAARLPAGRHARQGRPVPAPAVRRALRHVGARGRRAPDGTRERSRSRRSRTCAGARSTTRSSSSTRRRTPRPSR